MEQGQHRNRSLAIFICLYLLGLPCVPPGVHVPPTPEVIGSASRAPGLELGHPGLQFLVASYLHDLGQAKVPGLRKHAINNCQVHGGKVA